MFVLDEVLRKTLWLKIALFAIGEHKSIKPAIEIMKESDCLKIEDILPHFPDFVVIDDFKDDICSALEQYAATPFHWHSSFPRTPTSLASHPGTAATSTACAAAWTRRPSALIASER